MKLNLNTEVAQVQQELLFFRATVLPVLVDSPTEDGPTLSQWQQAAARLSDLLPLGPVEADSANPSRDKFRDYMVQEATPAYAVRYGRIVWQTTVFVNQDACNSYCQNALGNQDDLPAIRQWLMSLPVDSSVLWNALCVVLPMIIEDAPEFAGFALDPETWRQIAQSNPSLTDEERTKQLQIIDGHFGYILNNALLHVLGSLANNHFLLIEEFLQHPHLHGSYTNLMPHYLFAVLFEKVVLLRQLSQERPDLWE